MNQHKLRAVITGMFFGSDGPEQYSETVYADEVTEQVRQIIANGGDIVSVEPLESESDEEAHFDQWSREHDLEEVPF
jgi:hypothetical protein